MNNADKELLVQWAKENKFWDDSLDGVGYGGYVACVSSLLSFIESMNDDWIDVKEEESDS